MDPSSVRDFPLPLLYNFVFLMYLVTLLVLIL